MPWGPLEKKTWFEQQKIQRSYQQEVVSQIEKINPVFEVIPYGALSVDPSRYPLFLLRSKVWAPHKPTVIVTGGVHGYETSGVHGALEAVNTLSSVDLQTFNFLCAPCLSPWAYETINRWNPEAIDPNRSFYNNSPAEECALFLKAVAQTSMAPLAHFDLHETTDTDNTVFRPALEQRDGVPQDLWDIPDGFYLVGDAENPQKDFQKAIIDSVRKVTHIAPHDRNHKIIGVPVDQEGVILYAVKKLSLCAGFSNAKYTTTTEVYPDSPRVTPQICVQAQVAAVHGGLQYLRSLAAQA